VTAPTKAEVEAAIKRCRHARIHSCGAWSDVMEGGTVNVHKCNEASKAEDELAAAIAALARLALAASAAADGVAVAAKTSDGTSNSTQENRHE
jgi:hypothetical protein